MIWFTLGLFVVSFLLTALLAPKPEFENARAEELDPENFPRATESAPVPLVLGRVPVKGINTLWYGNFRSVPITEKVKTGLFSSTRVTVGHKYYLSLDLGICLGPAGLLGIKIDNEPVFSGDETDITEVSAFWSADGSPPFPFYWSGSVGAPRTIDLVTEVGLSEELIDSGQVVFKAGGGVIATVGGDPAGGSWSLESRVRDTDGNIITVVGQSAGSSQVGGDYFDIEYNIPAGARTIDIWFEYAASLHLFASYSLYDFYADVETNVVFYNTVTNDINAPRLFGGEKSGGGWVGNFSFYPGNFTQAVDSHVESSVGAGNAPAYRGTCHIVLPNNYIGESAALRPMEFDVYSYSDNLSNGFAGRIAQDSFDMDPAEAMYEILTNKWRGIGLDPADIDIDSFQAASTTLISEANGVSIIVSAARDAKSVLTEILRQVDGILVQSEEGKIQLKLIRDDYVAGDLVVYDEDDIIEVTSFSKTAWEDVRSQVKVTFSTRDTDSNKTAIAQNMAVANMVGKLTTADVSFPFCYDPNLANRLAARELSVLSIPLFNMTVKMNRNGYRLRPADVIKVSWPEYGLTEVIMRVQKVNLGGLDDNSITVELVQDVFAVGTAVLAAPVDSGWVDDRPEPESVTASLVEMPYFFSSNLEEPIPDGFAGVIPLPIQPKIASTSFDMLAGTVTGELDYREPEDIFYPISGLLTAALDKEDGFETGVYSTGITIGTVVGGEDQTPSAATTAEIRDGSAGIIYMNGEWLSYEGVTDNGDDTFTLDTVRRGLFGTRPLTHAIDTRMFIIQTSMLGKGYLGNNLAEDGTAYYKILDRVGAIVRDQTEETESSQAMADIADRPLRPRNLQIAGARRTSGGPVVVSGVESVSWVASNRAVGQVTFETDSAETPDQTETYDVEVWVDGVEQVGLALTGVSSPQNIDFTGLSGTEYEVRVYARRTGGDTKSSVHYAWIPFTVGGYGYGYGYDYGGA